MGACSAYLTAVVAGAMTAGIGAANVLAVPPDAAEPAQSTARDVDLSAYFVIPIIDFDETVGPLRLVREIAIEAGTNPLLLGIIQQGGNSYNLPGLNTLVNSTSNPRVQAEQGPDYLDFAFLSDRTESAGWSLLGDVVTSEAEVNGSRNVHFRPLLGGAEGIGARLYGTLDETAPNTPISRSLSVLGSGFETESNRRTGVFDGALSVVPFNGFKAVGDGTLVEGDNTTTANLGPLQFGAGSSGALGGNAGLCLGSAKETNGCGTDTAFAGLNAPITLGLGTGGSSTNIFSVDFPENNLAVALGDGRFSVEGQLGGTVSVGGLEFGRPIDIDFQIPRASSLMSSTSSSQQQTVRNSFLAVPGKTGSDNGTSSTGRHAASDMVNSTVSSVRTAVKTAVSNVTQSKPRHAKPDTED
jgi:hypothetical protein